MSEVTGDTVAATIRRKGKSLNPRNQARWEARNEKYKLLWNDYYTSADREHARFKMAKNLRSELMAPAIVAFTEKGANYADAEDYVQKTVFDIIQKLDNGYYQADEIPFDYFRTHVTKMKHVSHGRAVETVLWMNKHEPAIVDKEDTDGKLYAEDATADRGAEFDGNGNPTSPPDPNLTQLSILNKQDKPTTALIAAFNDSALDTAKMAASLEISTATASKQLSRLKYRLKLSELEATLQQIFGEQNYSKAASDILPLIPILTQRPTNEYPTSWKEALTLKPLPKTRRVADDRPKSTWIQAVRWPYRLWLRDRSADEHAEQTVQIGMLETNPENCFKPFEDTICKFQEFTANAGGLEAIKYGRSSEVGKATHTGSSQTIVPSISDFICDVTFAARRSLTTGEYAYFKMFYESRVVVVEPEDKSCLQAHINGFPESKRAAAKSLDTKIRLKLGARLIQVGIFPFADYIKPMDTRRAKVLPQVQACADAVQPKRKLLPWPSTGCIIDLQAAASDEYLTPQEVAAILKVSTDTVLRRFVSYPGVIDLGSSETRFKRRYRVLRIPRQILDRFILENRICA